MRMVTGYLPISSGSVSVCGLDVATKPTEIKQKIGYLPEGAPLYGDMTPFALLDFVAGVRGFSGADKTEKIKSAIAKLELETVANRPIDTLSKGYKRRVGLAQAILHDPEVLILDEPTDGLDPNQKHQVRKLIRDMSSDKAIIISTHILEEVEAVCTRAVIIASGRIVFDGSPGDLQAKSYRHNAVTIQVRPDVMAVVRAECEAIPAVERVENGGGASSLIVIPKNREPIVHLVSEVVRTKGLEVDEVFVERGNLDEVFHQLTLNVSESA
jgi:ABC-2 type transport system ATP-binding protein